MVSGRTGGYSFEVDMGGKRVQLLVLLTFVVAVTNCADPNTTVTSTTANKTTNRNATNPASTTTSRNATNPASTTTTNPAISDNPATSPPPDPSDIDNNFIYFVTDPEIRGFCISVATSISIKVKYITTDYHIKETFLKIPSTANITGTCKGEAPTVQLTWAEDPTLEGTLNRITLMIGSKHITYSLHVTGYELYIDGKNFPNAIKEGNRFECELHGYDEFSAAEDNGYYRCEPETTASTVDVHITFPRGMALGQLVTGNRTDENGVSGADMTQWSGYLLLAAEILIFLKLGHQGI